MKKINLQVAINQESRLKEMIDLAKEIQRLNPGYLLSGSLALYLQDCNIRRFPADIDFYFPPGSAKINMPDGYMEGSPDVKDTYEYHDFFCVPFHKQGAPKVEFFSHDLESELSENAFRRSYAEGLNMIHKADIMQLKIDHCMSESGNPLKHKFDVIHFLTNN